MLVPCWAIYLKLPYLYVTRNLSLFKTKKWKLTEFKNLPSDTYRVRKQIQRRKGIPEKFSGYNMWDMVTYIRYAG